MLKYHLSIAFCLFLVISSFAQGTIRGRVTDHLGETVIGAAIVLKSDPTKGTITDFDGKYSLTIESADATVIIVSFIGFKNIEATIHPVEGEVLILNFDLVPKDYDLREVVIEAKADRAGDYYMEKVKKNAATSIDYISSETMRKVGDTRVSAAIQRVTGVSNVNGYVTVRGLSDRYVLTAVNGSRIPTLDPSRNNIDLDIFPTGLVDNLIVTKTGNPDLPGSLTAAYISIETKDYPDKLEVNFSTSVGFNSQSTFEDIVTSQKSKTDWLGWDNGFRDIPDETPVTQENFPRLAEPGNGNRYRQYTTLGLAGFMASFGVGSDANFQNNGAIDNLALIELDLLGRAQYGDEGAIADARTQYNSMYPSSFFFNQWNKDLANIGTSFNNNNWFATTTKAPLNSSINFSIGNQSKLFGKTIGFIAGFRHSRSTESNDDAYFQVLNANSIDFSTGEFQGADVQISRNASRETSTLSALGKFSLKLNKNNSVSILVMPNFFGQNNARLDNNLIVTGSEQDLIRNDVQLYEERKQLIYQIATEHYLPGPSSKLKFDVSYTDGFRNIPGFIETRLKNALEDSTGVAYYELQPIFDPIKRYRVMDDNILDARASIEMPLFTEMQSVAKVKFGGAFLRNDRETKQSIYLLNENRQRPDLVTYENRYELISPEDFVLNADDGTLNLYYSNLSIDLDSDVGFKTISSLYAMMDYNLTTRLRAVGGLRLEHTDILSDILTYHDQGLAAGSSERRNIGEIQANPSTIRQLNVLPSVSVIYNLKKDVVNPSNLRLNFYSSLARPGFREISTVQLSDYELGRPVQGNPDLKITTIQNFDLRFESYLRGGSNYSVSLFYKDFKNHIEFIQIPGAFSWQNVDKSYAYGLEVEGRYKLSKRFELRGNVTFINSQTTITEPAKETRSMYGQAPYIINGILSYTEEKWGLNISVSYNRNGRRIAFTRNAAVTIPNIYELPRDLININLSKNLGKHIQLSARIDNLLNESILRAYDFKDDSGEYIPFDRYTWGTVYTFTLSYTL